MSPTNRFICLKIENIREPSDICPHAHCSIHRKRLVSIEKSSKSHPINFDQVSIHSDPHVMTN